jgi:hypothetical protein
MDGCRPVLKQIVRKAAEQKDGADDEQRDQAGVAGGRQWRAARHGSSSSFPMLTVADLEPQIESEFGSRLKLLGFEHVGDRKWVRSRKHPIRELFVIGAPKGARYSPVWGFSSGLAPSFRGRSFRRQSTAKNAIMDLVIDPIDTTGAVPPQAFGFFTGWDAEIPTAQIRNCAEHFVPLALADFDRVSSVPDFCQFFLERSRLEYRRFGFDMYVQHQLVLGFVLLFLGRREEGIQQIREFCRSMEAEFADRVLTEYIRHAGSDGTEG